MNNFRWDVPIRLGEIQVRVGHNEILVNDEVRRLQPKVMDVLCVLIEAGGLVVSKTDLIDRVWPNMTVPDRVLVDAVHQLRRTLGDDVRFPKYIRTIHGRGYCIAADVRSELGQVTENQPLPSKPQIVVTIFKSLGPEFTNFNFCEGLADDLTHLVGLNQSLRVLGSIPALEDWSLSMRALKGISRLGATHLISGSMRRYKGRLRVVARLIDAQSGTQIWSGVYNREPTDQFSTQEDIAESIVNDVVQCLSLR